MTESKTWEESLKEKFEKEHLFVVEYDNEDEGCIIHSELSDNTWAFFIREINSLLQEQRDEFEKLISNNIKEQGETLSNLNWIKLKLNEILNSPTGEKK